MINRAFLELGVLVRPICEVKGIHTPPALLWKGVSWYHWGLLPALLCQKGGNFFQKTSAMWGLLRPEPAVCRQLNVNLEAVLQCHSSILVQTTCGGTAGMKENLDLQWLMELTVCLDHQGQISALRLIRCSCVHFLSRLWRTVSQWRTWMESCHAASGHTATIPARTNWW